MPAKVYPASIEENGKEEEEDDDWDKSEEDNEEYYGEGDQGVEGGFVEERETKGSGGGAINLKDVKKAPMSQREKEIHYVMHNVQGRIKTLRADEMFQLTKWKYFIIALVFAMMGVTLICYGWQLTYFFEAVKGSDIAFGIGCALCFPMVMFFAFIFMPNRAERIRRRILHMEREERKRPSLFNQLADEAKKFATPPPRKVRVLAHFRKHDYPIVCSSWKEFCEEFESIHHLPIERQLIRFKGEDLEIDLSKKLDVDYGIDTGDRLYIYNKGGFWTKDHKLIKQHEELKAQERFLATASPVPLSVQKKELARLKYEKIQGILKKPNQKKDDLSRMIASSATNERPKSQSKNQVTAASGFGAYSQEQPAQPSGKGVGSGGSIVTATSGKSQANNSYLAGASIAAQSKQSASTLSTSSFFQKTDKHNIDILPQIEEGRGGGVHGQIEDDVSSLGSSIGGSPARKSVVSRK
jgi:hypothetical protein